MLDFSTIVAVLDDNHSVKVVWLGGKSETLSGSQLDFWREYGRCNSRFVKATTDDVAYHFNSDFIVGEEISASPDSVSVKVKFVGYSAVLYNDAAIDYLNQETHKALGELQALEKTSPVVVYSPSERTALIWGSRGLEQINCDLNSQNDPKTGDRFFYCDIYDHNDPETGDCFFYFDGLYINKRYIKYRIQRPPVFYRGLTHWLEAIVDIIDPKGRVQLERAFVWHNFEASSFLYHVLTE